MQRDKKDQFGYGDVWIWTAIYQDTKLVISWPVGIRNAAHARVFISDLKERLATRVQMTTDGLKIHLETVDEAFSANIDYATPSGTS